MLKRVRLIEDWGPRKAGEVVEVDAVRAAKLVEDGLATEDVEDGEA